jgi:hypothetical protein
MRTAAGRVTPGLIITLACLFCAEGKTVVRFASVSDPNFYDNADPDPDSDRLQNDADPTPRFTNVGKSFFKILSPSFDSLLCFIFFISVKYVIILNFLDPILKIFWNKSLVSKLFYLLGIYIDQAK